MLIESVTAKGFGALRERTLPLGPGLTVVCGRNESAKSTWHAAVYAAVCGRARRRGAGTRTQQEFAARHRPWNGDLWEVEARLLLDDGRTIGMHHDLDGLVNCAATDLTTGRDVSAEIMYDGSPDASRWLGMNRDIFSAIACVRQADILSVLASAGALQEQLESAATHAGTSDPTAAQAIAIIAEFLKENVGTQRANSTKPLRQAVDEVHRARVALAQARDEHEQYMFLVRQARSLREDARMLEADLEHAAAAVSRLVDRQARVEAVVRIDAELQAALAHSQALSHRLQSADRLRAHGADQRPEVAADTSALTQAVRALTRWRTLPEPPPLVGPDAATLRAQRDALPLPPTGEQRPDPEVTQAMRRLQITQELAAQKQREEPTVPDLSSQGLAAASVGAVTLRAWASELDRISAAPTQATPPEDAGEVRARTLVMPALGVVAALAGLALVLTGSTPLGSALIVAGLAVALLRRRTSPDGLAQTRHALALATQTAATHRRAVHAQITAASLPVDAQALHALAAEVDRWDQQRTRRTAWDGQARSANAAVDAARRALAESLRLRGISDADPEAGYAQYEAACEQRAQQAGLARRREVLTEQLSARLAAEKRVARAEADARTARAQLREAAIAAGLDTDDPDALDQWVSAAQAAAADLGTRHDAWTRYQTALGGLTHDGLRRQSADASATATALQDERDAAMRELGTIDDDLATAVVHARATYEAVKGELERRREQAAIAEGKQQERSLTLASVAEAEERLAAAEREQARVRELEARLRQTQQYLQDAQEAVHRSMAPTLQATLVRWLPRVTDGRYTQAGVDPQTLRVRVRTGAGSWVDASQLSVGTAEQIYLLLRVALVMHLSAPDTSCPLLLDDVTVQADEPRTRALLDTLSDIASQRQVVLFAQDQAVVRWAEDHEGARLIRLEQVPA